MVHCSGLFLALHCTDQQPDIPIPESLGLRTSSPSPHPKDAGFAAKSFRAARQGNPNGHSRIFERSPTYSQAQTYTLPHAVTLDVLVGSEILQSKLQNQRLDNTQYKPLLVNFPRAHITGSPLAKGKRSSRIKYSKRLKLILLLLRLLLLLLLLLLLRPLLPLPLLPLPYHYQGAAKEFVPTATEPGTQLTGAGTKTRIWAYGLGYRSLEFRV